MLDAIWKEANIFHNVLQSFRVRRGKSWTQEATAELLGVKLRKYIGWENGESIPSREELKKIVAVFGLNQEEEEALYLAAWQAPPKICQLPFSRNPLFTGRQAYLDQLRQFLHENGSVALTQPVSISGLGGIGKSQLALEYAYRCFPKVYRTVFWVNAADRTTLQAGYYALAHRLKLPDIDERNPEQCVQAVKQWLVDRTNWLLIMDNADDLPLARSFFPEVNHGHILLTTRSQFAGKIGARQIEIEKMEPAEGLVFLLRRSLPRLRKLEGDTNLDTVAIDIREAALQLVELLGGHPLALDQAGAYIEETGVSFTDYINLYQKQRRLLLDKPLESEHSEHPDFSQHPETVVVTFELCFTQARARHPLATDILHFCAFLQPDAIPEELFQHDDSFKLDALAFNRGISALQRYSLIKRNMQEQTLSMHRLVQAVLIDDMSPDLQKQWRAHVVRALNAIFPEVAFTDLRLCERLLSHALACAAWTKNELNPTIEVAELFHKEANYLRELEQYIKAESLERRALSIFEQDLGAEHPDTASALSSLGVLYYNQGMYKQAESLLVRALSIQEKQLGTEHPITARSLHNVAALYSQQGKYEQAEALHHQVLAIREKHIGTGHPDTASSLESLAILYSQQGKYKQAELFYRRATRIWEKHLGAEHHDIARRLQWLARLLHRQGKHEQAEALNQRALHIYNRILEATHIDTQMLKFAYAIYLDNLGRDSEAAALEMNYNPIIYKATTL